MLPFYQHVVCYVNTEGVNTEVKCDCRHQRRQASNIHYINLVKSNVKSLTLSYCYYVTLKVNGKYQTFKIKWNSHFLFCSKRNLCIQLKTFKHIQKHFISKRLLACEMSGATHSSGIFKIHQIWTSFCITDLQYEVYFHITRYTCIWDTGPTYFWKDKTTF